MKKVMGARLRAKSAIVTAVLLCSAAMVTSPSQATATTQGTTPVRVASTTGQTKYPIVLVHGLYGFDSIGGIDYFYGVPKTLAGAGAKVYVAQMSAANSSEIRGEQLIAELKNIRALSGDPVLKFNLVGHSQGSPTARYVAAVSPDLVASVTSVGGINNGTAVADMDETNYPAGSAEEASKVSTIKLLTKVIALLSGKDSQALPEDPLNALHSMTTEGMKVFNTKYPQGLPPAGSSCDVKSGPAVVNGIRYYSWAGNAPSTNMLDPSDSLMIPMARLVFSNVANDGMVSTCSSRLGTHLGDFKQNHFDEVNQLLGLVNFSLWSSEKKPLQLYLDHAARLKTAGL